MLLVPLSFFSFEHTTSGTCLPIINLSFAITPIFVCHGTISGHARIPFLVNAACRVGAVQGVILSTSVVYPLMFTAIRLTTSRVPFAIYHASSLNICRGFSVALYDPLLRSGRSKPCNFSTGVLSAAYHSTSSNIRRGTFCRLPRCLVLWPFQ